ncbi:MAG: histidinol dehydrogenase [Deltaproteobacteria bacterium]|jgi:histidinol dehydrogenase|nr:histidinol dehydrogenase [Deltaproteobacteria bacterium]
MIKTEILEELSPERRKEILDRSAPVLAEIAEATGRILKALRADPEKEMTREYGHLKGDFKIGDLKVGEDEFERAFSRSDPDFVKALGAAAKNIETFHRIQLERPLWFTEVSPGVMAGRMTRPVAAAGVYVPGGRASYPSSALMTVIPAKVAGVGKVVCCSPPGENLEINAGTLVAAKIAGADGFFKLGGAWAVGAMAYGLAGVPKVDKVVGPGSSWVTAAKLAVYGEVDIDSPAGPSEGFVISDGKNDPVLLAWDFLAQLEHDPQAAAVLVTTDAKEAGEVLAIVRGAVPSLKRREIVEESSRGAAVLVAKDLKSAFAFSNAYAPEHLELAVEDPLSCLSMVENAGSVFLGLSTPIPAGDYATGTNHVLPTGGAARAFSGLSVDTFLKKITFQKLTREGLAGLAPTAETLAAAEGLECHAKAVRVRV